MSLQITTLTLVVADYDAAIQYYTEVFGFKLIEDTDMGGGKRWVVVAPEGAGSVQLLLAQASNEAQQARIGDQTGGRVFLFLKTDDFWSDYNRLKANGVTFQEEPRSEAYGTVVVLSDLYGNKWDLIEPA